MRWLWKEGDVGLWHSREGMSLLSVRNRKEGRTFQPRQVFDVELGADDDRVTDSLDSGGLRRGAGQGGRTRGFRFEAASRGIRRDVS